ncbi:MAG: hypothetical protein P8M17_07015 [Saprospiraceae bacterium]|jgi:hypothetical protein|nr:hypothetical protein [Saprospiraceae bacterium]MDB4539400.1 hypothetical protein [Saprospiraceae bacterium]MDC3210569.1 hypothetical protein [Saprospiraceae bacterium]MDG1434556.1 hypothetical protein [Saprospiraceae bacterium]MDG2418725.1 hypothetical protein [Saprospiraceae bacterium]
MKNLTPFSILILLFSNCSNEPSNPSPDIAYNLENVRVLVPREYKEVKSKEKVKEILFDGKDSLGTQNQILMDRTFDLQKEDNHIFAKYNNEQLSFITFKTDGDYQIMNKSTKRYILQQFEVLLERSILPIDPNYRYKELESKLTGANRVRFLKYKYTHTEKKVKWYSTKYLITSGNRTISMSIFSLVSNYSDMENYMQFIQIK